MPTSGAGTFEKVALELAKALGPLAGRLHDPHHAVMALGELGLRIPESALSEALTGTIQMIHRGAHDLGSLAEEFSTVIDGGDTAAIIAKGAQVATAIGQLISAFDAIADEFTAMGQVPGVDPADLNAFVAALPGRLFETIAAEYLEGHVRIPHAVLEFFGIVEKTRRNTGSSDPGKPEYVEKRLRFDRIGALLRSPDQVMRELYGWGEPGFDSTVLLQRLSQLLRALRVPVTVRQLPGTPPRQAIEVCVFALSPTPDGVSPPGLEATVTASQAAGVSVDLPVATGWEAHLGVEGAFGARTGVRVQPPAALSAIPPGGTISGRVSAGLARVPIPPGTRILLLGAAGGTGLSAERIVLDLVAGLVWDSATGRAVADVGFEARIDGGKLVLSMAGADGFIGTILSGIEVDADFTVGIGWTAGTGLYFVGSSGLEIQLPMHTSLGPVDLHALTLSVGIDGNRFPVALTTNVSAVLGPVDVVVEHVGAAVELSFPSGGRGDLGPLDIGFTFKPPTGVGLAVNAGIVTGGGFLAYDPARQEYAGALELEFAEFLTLKGIGLITTRMPDGSAGFSLLIILTAEFPGGGIQLGFGFRLLAVGGLVGLNRAMRIQALIDGVRTGAIESVMFPRDVIANAPRIVSDLRAFFPPEPGKFLIGPMAKLGWGTPTLVRVSVGVIFEIPGNIAIVGVLKVALPSEDQTLLLLQANFVGAIEFDNQRLFFFASLFDSRVLTITIGGELGLLVAWGDDPNFVVSVGGFHPSFSPPPLPFPVPRRVTVDILNRPGARITVSGYFAVTSNTAQFGARAELQLGFSDFGVSGHIAFDALFQFSPFAFVIQVSASVSLRAFGVGLFSVDLQFTLSGPTPWRAKGRGSISLLFFEISADFDITWGDDQDTSLPPVDVMPLVGTELAKREGWQTAAPTGGRQLVSLRPLAETDDLVLHPLGTLFIRQRAVPLDLRLDRIGAQRPADANRLHVDAAPGSSLVKRSDPAEQFALAQFQDMDDAAKLSRPAFERQHGGVELAVDGAAMASRRAVRRSARYEQIIIDTANRRRLRRFTPYHRSLFTHFLDGNAVSRSPLSAAQATLRQPFEETIRVSGDGFAVASTRENTAATTFASQAAAADHLDAQLAADPALAGTLHVIPTAEVRV